MHNSLTYNVHVYIPKIKQKVTIHLSVTISPQEKKPFLASS